MNSIGVEPHFSPSYFSSPTSSSDGEVPTVPAKRSRYEDEIFNPIDNVYCTYLERDGIKLSDGQSNIYSSAKHPPHRPTGTTQVLTFYPTMEQFKDFNGYIKKIEAAAAHSYCGICKIVPPKEWNPRPSKGRSYADIDNYLIKSPVQEQIEGDNDVYVHKKIIYKKQMSVADYRSLANSKKYRPPPLNLDNPREIEEDYFNFITGNCAIYGADTEGSIYDSDVDEFNMNRLGTVLDETCTAKLGGVNSVYLYFGMYKTTFPWHAEDMDLYSINYLHFGAPKYWFAIPSESAERFERIMDQYFPESAGKCKAFLRHKEYIVATKILREHRIPYGTMMQRPNEFIITFPKGYHMGFNLGYNCAESTNFASDRWIDFGKNAVLCKCSPHSVKIDMCPFMQKYRPDEFVFWKTYWYGSPSPVKKKRKAKKPSDAASKWHAANQAVWDNIRWCEATNPLWSSSPVNLEAEIRLNEISGKRWPYCAVCHVFNPMRNLGEQKSEIPKMSERLVGSSIFSRTKLSCPSVDPGKDELLTCANCQVRIHPSCYGNEKMNSLIKPEAWKCFRCRDNSLSRAAIEAISCHLCEMRGGALIPCINGRDNGFVHMVCAMFNRRTAFFQTVGPSRCVTYPPPRQAPTSSILKYLPGQYVTAMGVDYDKGRFQCNICHLSKEGLIKCSECPDDCEATLAHVTCGMRDGYLFEERDFPLCHTMVCHKHSFDAYDPRDTQWGKIDLGTEVTALIQQSTVVQGIVESVELCTYMAVYFYDGTLTKDTPAKDVVYCSCKTCDKKDHQYGAKVRVRWADGLIYDGYFRHAFPVYEHTIRTRAGELVIAQRNDIYGPGDGEIPKSWRKKLKD